MSKGLDTFEKWEKQGLLKEKLDLIEKLVSKNITQVKIAKALGISEKTLQKLKNRHIDFDRAFSKDESDMKYYLYRVYNFENDTKISKYTSKQVINMCTTPLTYAVKGYFETENED